MCILTKHAQKRVVQRCGVSKKTAKSVADRALDKGLRHMECNGELTKYLNGIYLSYQAANNLRLYDNRVWIFKNQTLITVYNLPTKYKRATQKLLRRRCDD